MRTCEVVIHLPVWKRQALFTRTIQDLAQTELPAGWTPSKLLLLVNPDDTDHNYSLLALNTPFPTFTIPWRSHLGCDRNILKGFRHALQNVSFQYLINLEDDTRLHPAWFKTLWELKWKAVGKAWSVYNSPKHRSYMMRQQDGFQILYKKTIGGFGLMMAQHTVRELLNYTHRKGVGRGWDWRLCEMTQASFITCSPSYMQHVGRTGAHTEAGDKHWDHAADFIGEKP